MESKISEMKNNIKMHILKMQTKYMYDVVIGAKKAELRKNDRDFKVGDLIHFTDVDGYEFVDVQTNMTPCAVWRITHILDVSVVIPKIKEGKYVILSIERIMY